MILDNLSPGDLLIVQTKDGRSVEARLIQVKRTLLQLHVVGPWVTNRQSKDARRSIKFNDLAAVVRTGRDK
jgi:hypothetical protein